jgi:hypothetical protein
MSSESQVGCSHQLLLKAMYIFVRLQLVHARRGAHAHPSPSYIYHSAPSYTYINTGG